MNPCIKSMLVLISIALYVPAWSAPFIPDNDETILLSVTNIDIPEIQSLRALRDTVKLDPSNEAAVLDLSNAYLELARLTGDARYVSYAQGLLMPWWNTDILSTALRFKRAQVHQALHDFNAAIIDLDRVLLDAPQHGNARLLRATLRQLQGDFSAAKKDCAYVMRSVDLITSLVCSAGNAVTEEQINRTLTVIDRLLPELHTREVRYQQWVYTSIAELSMRRGEWERALQYLDQAQGLGDLEITARALRADILLTLNRPQLVLAMIKESTPPDALLARKIVALRAVSDSNLSSALDLATIRLRESAQRAVAGHDRDTALLALETGATPAQALQLARTNWQLQREAIDLRVLVRAALVSGDQAAYAEIKNWLTQTGFYDAKTAELMQRQERAS